MRKLSISMLAAAMFMGLVSLSSAADVKISGKVDVRQNLGGINATETGFNMKAFDLREARVTAKAKISDTINAQVSDNLVAVADAANTTLEAANEGIGDTYVTFGLGNGTLLFGETSIPGFAIRETILNKVKFGNMLTQNCVKQLSYSGKADVVSYAIAIVDGSANTKGATTKDAIVNVGADVSGVKLGVTYNADTNDDNGIKGSFFAANAGYNLNPVDLTVQYIGGLDATVAGANDISDATASAPKNEIIVAIGYKLGEKHDLTLGYDMFGKSNSILLKCNCKIADGVTGILRADLLGSDYKKVDPVANNISLGVAAEF